jgi:hypothetical protein
LARKPIASPGTTAAGVAEDDLRRLAAQLERDAPEVLRGLHGDLPADLGAAGEGDLVHSGVARQRRAGRLAEA